MERTKPGRRVYNDCVPYGGRVPNHNKKEGMKLQKEQFDITGMTCSACSARIEKSVGKLPGIKEVSVNLLKNSMVASYDESVLDTAGIVQAVEKAGYGAFPKTAANVQNKSSAAGRTKNPETSTAQAEYKQMKQRLLAKEENCRSRLELLRETVEAADPNRILQKGYTILRDEEGNVILDVAALRKDQDVSLEGAGGFAEAKVVSARKKAGKKAEKR